MAKFKKVFSMKDPCWNCFSTFNEWFLKDKEGYYSSLLNNRGYVLLKDIYSDLGYEITQESLTFGWVKTKKDERIKMDIIPINGSSDFELIFECDSILEAFPKEEMLRC